MAAAGRQARAQPQPSASEIGPGDLFRSAAAATVEKATADHLRLAIRLTLARSELRPLCAGVRFAIDASLDLPFCVARADRIVLHPDSLADPIGAALILRHALELALWQRLAAPEVRDQQRPVRAYLTCRVAARYGAILPAHERVRGLAALPAWLASAHAALAAGADPDWAGLPAELLRLEGGAVEAPTDPASRELIAKLEALALPSEQLLVSGGGQRLHLDPATGRNPYGCSALPEPDSLAFASSTASTISAPAYRAVEALRQELIGAGLAGRLPAALAATIAGIRRGILEAAGAADLAGTEVVLTPSGTDGEYLALHLARRRATGRLVNLVIAPDETGRGLRDAARGLHFGSDTPAGAAVVAGQPLAGVRPEQISVETVEIRAPDGTARRPAAIDAEVKARALRAVARGARCLVHVLEVSKSGLCAPGLAAIRELVARHRERIDVVVDACQLRQGPASLRSYLEAGWMVLLTGSKFAMGPPFSGALLIPARLAEQMPGLDPLPAGYGQYFARPEWPESWRPLTEALPATANLGLLCRWQAALFELQACRTAPEALRLRVVEQLGDAIRQAIEASPWLEPVALEGERPPSIFSFRIFRRDPAGQRRALDVDAARAVWQWLREDLSDRLPAGSAKAEQRLAALICQVGQPIHIGTIDGVPAGALRICIGAHQIAEVALDPALGKSAEQRLQRQIGRVRTVLDKIELLARHFDHLHTPPAADLGNHLNTPHDAGAGDHPSAPTDAGADKHLSAPAGAGVHLHAKDDPGATEPLNAPPDTDARDHLNAPTNSGADKHRNAPAGAGDHLTATDDAGATTPPNAPADNGARDHLNAPTNSGADKHRNAPAGAGDHLTATDDAGATTPLNAPAGAGII